MCSKFTLGKRAQAGRDADICHIFRSTGHDMRMNRNVGRAVSARGASALPVSVLAVSVLAVSALPVSAAGVGALVLVAPAAGDQAVLSAQVTGPQATSPKATPFDGTSAVGALFTDRHGRLRHFCTASVVHSPRGNLLITAAHCMRGKDPKAAGAVTFAPGYHDGKFPHGRWLVRAVYVDRRWRRARDPDDDVAFLLAGRPGLRIEKYTGAETLATDARLPQEVRVVGYPDTTSRPVTCAAPARVAAGHPRQLVFRRAGYTDGTSGGPFLARLSRARGTGRVIGVIGGYQEGGDSPSVSYSSRFLANVAALYRRATG
jgi:V8-like Glu-specific endopeptidase